MAENKRIVTRREPITVQYGKETFIASPLPWRVRNDFGNAVVQHYADSVNRSLVSETDGQGNLSLSWNLPEELMNYPKLLELGYPENKLEDFDALDFEGLVAVLDAALEVNGLERHAFMIDPRKKDGLGNYLAGAIGEAAAGLKIESGQDSSSPELTPVS